MTQGRIGVVIAAMAAAAWSTAGISQAAPAPAGPKPPSVYTEFHPNLSDLMTMSVQPRHTKLGLGIRARNWTYAAYEVNELRGAFNRIVRSMPGYEGQDTAQIVTIIAKPIENLQAAIKAQDPGKADAAYAEVTDACNMCHESQERPYIKIRPPAAAMYPDQEFSPAR